MRRARAAIMAHGGADAVNSFTRFYLALLGQISYEQCPAVPPELVLLPKWFPVNLYAVSAWSRTIVVPLSIISALRPVRRIEPRLGIRELFLREPENWPRLRCPGLTGGTRPAELGPLLPHDRQAVEVVPAASAVAAAAEGPGRGRALDAHPLRPQRRPRGDLSADRLEHHRAEMSRLSRRQPRGAILSRGTAEAAIEDPRTGHDAAPALQVARVGHGDCGACLGGQRRAARKSRPARGRRLAAGAADQAAGRLDGNRLCRAGRMVLRIRQRLLSRLRRHGDGVDGLQTQFSGPPAAGSLAARIAAGRGFGIAVIAPVPPETPPPSNERPWQTERLPCRTRCARDTSGRSANWTTRCWRSLGAALAAGHAEPRRRLGGF